MLREIRKITSRAKANYLRRLQKNGKIGKHINSKGYVCYDSEELIQKSILHINAG